MSKLLDSIVANEEVVMTDKLVRAFRRADCDPACHCCLAVIMPGDIFKLQIIKTKDKYGDRSVKEEMLCKDCTADMLISKRKKSPNSTTYRPSRNSGYSRPSAIACDGGWGHGYTRKHI